MELAVEGEGVFAGTGGAPFSRERPCLVFVHGAGMDHTVWAFQVRYFAHHGYAVLAVDLPGHGRSGGPPLRSIPDLGAWLLRVLDAVRVEQAALVGHSLGGLVALEGAAQAPERASALALLGCGARIPVHPDLLAAAETSQRLAFELMTSWGHERRSHLGGHQTPGLWMMGGTIRLLQRGAPGTLYVDLKALNEYEGGAEAAGRVRSPTLALIGEHDVMTRPEAGRELAARIEGSHTVVIPGAGHMMMIERPDGTLDALRDFLRARSCGCPP